MLILLALFGFGATIALFVLAMVGAALMVVLRILTGVLWLAVKIVEHRAARRAEPEILIMMEEAERRVMRDITR